MLARLPGPPRLARPSALGRASTKRGFAQPPLFIPPPRARPPRRGPIGGHLGLGLAAAARPPGARPANPDEAVPLCYSNTDRADAAGWSGALRGGQARGGRQAKAAGQGPREAGGGRGAPRGPRGSLAGGGGRRCLAQVSLAGLARHVRGRGGGVAGEGAASRESPPPLLQVRGRGGCRRPKSALDLNVFASPIACLGIPKCPVRKSRLRAGPDAHHPALGVFQFIPVSGSSVGFPASWLRLFPRRKSPRVCVSSDGLLTD